MASHKFQVGEIVNLRPIVSRNVPGGAYEVTKQLPHNGREFEYRIKSASEEHEHVVGESDLTRPWGPARAPLWNPGGRALPGTFAPSLPQSLFLAIGFLVAILVSGLGAKPCAGRDGGDVA